MLPMRSIPFKIIAVLGLNDGEFPRQRQPLSFDLMTTTPAQLGDRSRRGDDRYLFLEAIISARQALYLSFQGKNIKNNKDRQPSLVLKELMEYLARGYGWQLLGLNSDSEVNILSQVRQLPMQAFSEQNYLGQFASFDANWLNLRRENPALTTAIKSADADLGDPLDVVNSEAHLVASELIRFYQHPGRYYAQKALYLYLDNTNTLINDVEPFVPNHLDSYLLRQDLLSYYLAPTQSKQSCQELLLSAKLSGSLPDLPSTDELIKGWQQDSENFSQFIITELAQGEDLILTKNDCSVTLNLAHFLSNNLAGSSENTSSTAPGLFLADELAILTAVLPQRLTLSTKLTLVANKAVFYRSSSAKAKDLFTLYLHQLIIQVAQTDAATHELFADITATHGYYFDTKSQKPSQFYFSELVDAKTQLLCLVASYFLGQHQPLLLNGDLAEKVRKSKVFEQAQFEQFWTDSNSFQAFGDEPYIQYFWRKCPDFDDISPRLLALYQPMFDALQTVKVTAKSGALS